MGNGLKRVRQYFAGPFTYDMLKSGHHNSSLKEEGARASFESRAQNFHQNYDDFYHEHYALYGDSVKPVIATVAVSSVAFQGAYGHMNWGYMNHAISGGTHPNQDAVRRNACTTDDIGNIIGSSRHYWSNILDNSERSLSRAKKMQLLAPDIMLYNPTAYEAAPRALANKEGAHQLTGGLQFKGADFMSFHNINLDGMSHFFLDDLRLDMPSQDHVMAEIKAAQAYEVGPGKYPLKTNDWANSPNSIFEIARAVYIAHGLHPLRPDRKMDIYLYDEQSNRLYRPDLLDISKPIMQNILRWAPQGLATERACTTVARFFNIHHMGLTGLTSARAREFGQFIDKTEPFLLKYCGHLIKPAGLPEKYLKARLESPVSYNLLKIKDHVKNEALVRWQRTNMPAEAVAELWPATLPRPIENLKILRKPATFAKPHIMPVPIHDFFGGGPFEKTKEDKYEIWPDRPFEDLSQMEQVLARVVVGTLELGLPPINSPDYRGLRFDLKRGIKADKVAAKERVHDISLLQGELGRKFNKRVRRQNLERAYELLDQLRVMNHGHGKTSPTIAFGTPHIAEISDAIKELRSDFTGPGPQSPSSDFRLAIEMENMRRNCTIMVFQDGWENSEDSARMMLQATLIEFGKMPRRKHRMPNELQVLAEDGHYISLAERIKKLGAYLQKLSSNENIRKLIVERDESAIELMGVRHISLTLARLIEIYDCLNDPMHNHGRFELQSLQPQSRGLEKNLHEIYDIRSSMIKELVSHWIWLWNPETDFKDLPDHYLSAWKATRGRQAQHAGPLSTQDEGLVSRYG